MNNSLPIPDAMQTFVSDIKRLCEEKDIACNIEEFHHDDIRELLELSSSSEEYSSDDENAYKWVWRAEIALHKGEHSAEGILRYFSYPVASLMCAPLEKVVTLSFRNVEEFLDSFANT